MANVYPKTPERRIAPRVSFTGHLRIRKPRIIHATGSDLAATGITIVVQQPLPEGSPVELELFGGTTHVDGTVHQVSQALRGYRMGVEFREQHPEIVAKAMSTRF